MFGMTHEIYFSYIKNIYLFIFSQAWDPNEKV